MLLNNYIPHKRNKRINYRKWFLEYKKDILNLYSILKETIEIRYPEKKIDWESDKLFNDFCVLIYKNSSGYVPKWI